VQREMSRCFTKFHILAGAVPMVNFLPASVLLLTITCILPAFPQDSQATSGSATPEVSPQSDKKSDAVERETLNEQGDKQGQAKKDKKKTPRGSLVIAPLPISSPAIGNGLVLIAGYIFPFSTKDKVSPPSTIGGAGVFTNNGSRGFVLGGQFFLKENTYEITTGFARGNIDYSIYGSGVAADLKLPLKQTGDAFFGEFLRRLGWKFFAGPRFTSGRSVLTLQPSSVQGVPIPPDLGFHTNINVIGARLTRDTRPSHFYPTSGTFFTFTSDFSSQALNSKYSFQSYKTQFDKYWSLSKNQVLAYDGFFCATGGQPPFYGTCIYGTSNELRGYTAGRYFTNFMLATQIEYRLVLPKRFGLVAFGGLGGVIPGGNQLLQLVQRSHFLPSGGGGLRFELSKAYHVNLRADIAQGRDGHTFSLGVGEAF
jgi:hypothetical protein